MNKTSSRRPDGNIWTSFLPATAMSDVLNTHVLQWACSAENSRKLKNLSSSGLKVLNIHDGTVTLQAIDLKIIDIKYCAKVLRHPSFLYAVRFWAKVLQASWESFKGFLDTGSFFTFFCTWPTGIFLYLYKLNTCSELELIHLRVKKHKRNTGTRTLVSRAKIKGQTNIRIPHELQFSSLV